jgi:hypothetical protein
MKISDFFFFLSDYRDLKRVHGESVQWIVMRRKIWERKYRMDKEERDNDKS